MSRGPALSRRALLAGGMGLAAGAAGGALLGPGRDDDGATPAAADVVAFHGEHQAGIVTPAQDRLHFAAFDVTVQTRGELRDLLRSWSQTAERLTRGLPAGPRHDVALAPPDDTGEADGLAASRLTLTFGLGPGLFEAGRGFGLETRRPGALRALPRLPGDELDPDRSGGDLCVQACADDPQVAFHAVRNLARVARGAAALRWSQLGFGRTATTSRAQETPRNLMGFKDGTNNLRAEDGELLDRHVWVGSEGPAWMAGGTYLVARRIRMLIEAWDRASLQDQEQTIGRLKRSGAPIGGHDEFDAVDAAKLPPTSHVRLARPPSNGGAHILRRGYSFTDGDDARLGQLDAGLFFLSFQRDPEQFVAIQRRLGEHDALNEYIKHVSSAVFAIPPGASPGGWVGERLFA